MVGIGYADLRKGFDIFLQLWRLMNVQGRVHFCWLGDMDPELKRWLGDEIRLAEQTGLFHTPGQVRDVTPALSAASAFLLTSREDPFPTVALEALSAGLPVVAFAGTGGIPELLVEQNVGFAVPYGDVSAMAAALEDALTEETGGAAEIARMALIEKAVRLRALCRPRLRVGDARAAADFGGRAQLQLRPLHARTPGQHFQPDPPGARSDRSGRPFHRRQPGGDPRRRGGLATRHHLGAEREKFRLGLRAMAQGGRACHRRMALDRRGR